MLIAGTVFLLIRWILRQDPAPIFGIYSQPGKFYYIKFVFFYLTFTLRKVFFLLNWINYYIIKYYVNSGKIIKGERKGRLKLINRLEMAFHPSTILQRWNASSHYLIIPRCRPSPIYLTNLLIGKHVSLYIYAELIHFLLQAIDAVYFQGANKDGVYFVTATARRPQRVINGFIFLKVLGALKKISPIWNNRIFILILNYIKGSRRRFTQESSTAGFNLVWNWRRIWCWRIETRTDRTDEAMENHLQGQIEVIKSTDHYFNM